MRHVNPSFLLFVPGDRPDRFDKARASGAGGVIFDLEDAVAPEQKSIAREAVATFLDMKHDPARIVVRINGAQSPWFADDLAMLEAHPGGAIMLPKTNEASALTTITSVLGNVDVIALIESARGVLNASAIAAHPHCIALAFGPFDLAADLGSADDWGTMLAHRSHVLIAARAHGKAAIDGPTLTFKDAARTEADARAAMRLGYDGKLLIHPAQIAPTRNAFRPEEERVARASRIIEAAKHAMPAVVDGMMIDPPLLAAAQRVMSLHEAFSESRQ